MFAKQRGDVRNISLPINARERRRVTCKRISRENGFPGLQVTAIDWKYIVEPSEINETHTKYASKIERYSSHERGWKVYPVGFYSIVYLILFNRVSDRVIRVLCGNLTRERVSRCSDYIGGLRAEFEVKGDRPSGSKDRLGDVREPNGKGNSGSTPVNRCDRSSFKVVERAWHVERHPEGPSVRKEKDAEVTYTCICALAGNQRPRSCQEYKG